MGVAASALRRYAVLGVGRSRQEGVKSAAAREKRRERSGGMGRQKGWGWERSV